LPEDCTVVPDSRLAGHTDEPCGSAQAARIGIHGCCGILNGHDRLAADDHRLYTRLSDF
jgi:hypothetical protein